ncbi:uncharacterized protein LOC116205813 isoform X3 [Punica granatum]|uniref:Uncharacterized protein LOC116205813 isoform X3 n=1 Tax=Punica granatum TaxID=22663 RepID=A0A6P8DIT9_PUNGR|nr:uncharacterized protein LOC116205813 isoform X3 [Punica granatum]
MHLGWLAKYNSCDGESPNTLSIEKHTSTFPGKTTKASNDQLLWELGLSCEAKREQLNNTKKSQERSENPEGRDSCTCPPLYRPRLSHMPSTPPAEIVGG